MRAKLKFYLPLTLTLENQVAIELALSIKENNIFSFVNSGTPSNQALHMKTTHDHMTPTSLRIGVVSSET